jgi:hypothetical protein
VLQNEGLGLLNVQGSGIDVDFRVFGGLVRVRNAGEVLDDTLSGLLIKTLHVAGFADFEGSANVDFSEVETSILVDLTGEVSARRVGGNEGNKDDLAGHREQLGDLGNAADVLGSVLVREAEALVEARADHVTIEDEDLLVVTNQGVNLGLEANRECGLSGTRETSEPVSGSLSEIVGAFTDLRGAGLVGGVKQECLCVYHEIGVFID